MENILPALIAAAAIGFVIYRQMKARKLSKNGLVVLPLILLFFLINSLSSFHPTQQEILEMVITTVITIAFGLLASRELHVYEGPTGKAMAKGNWRYFIWWIAAFIIKAGLSIVFKETSANSLNEVQILLPVFLLMASRSAYIYWKVHKLGLVLH